jgi:uncharacterized protein YkwD
MHRTIILPLVGIALVIVIATSAAAQAALPPADEIASADTAAFRVHLPLVVRPNPLFDLYPPVNRQWELEFIRLLNEERVRHGLHPLREHLLLTLAARRHAYDLGINKVPRGDCGGGRGHRGTDGTEPWHRVEQSGYPGRYEGEAIHCGAHDVAFSLQWLLNSLPHRAFLLSPIPVEVGVGAHPNQYRRGLDAGRAQHRHARRHAEPLTQARRRGGGMARRSGTMTEGVRDSTSAHFGDRSGMAPRRAAPALLRCSAAGRRFPFGSEKRSVSEPISAAHRRIGADEWRSTGGSQATTGGSPADERRMYPPLTSG